MSDSEGKPGFWGTTMNRLKSVLAKTKDQVGVEAAFEESAQASAQSAAPQPVQQMAAVAPAESGQVAPPPIPQIS